MAITRKRPIANFSDIEEKMISYRQQGDIRNRWLKYRLDNEIQRLMKEEDIEMWIVINRGEYNIDPMIMSLIPSPYITPMGKMWLFWNAPDGTFKKYYFRGRKPGPFAEYYDLIAPAEGGDQWSNLGNVVREINPKNIAINVSDKSQFADGLTHSDFLELEKALGPDMMARTMSSYRLVERWLGERTDEELVVYEHICYVIHSIMDEAFSPKVIHPGITTPKDVQWWIHKRMMELGTPPWFDPNFQARRKGYAGIWDLSDNEPIMPGDIVWCDVGITYMGLHTDHQEIGYVLRRGETDAPESFKKALKNVNIVQDAVAEAMVAGRTGNEILALAEEISRKNGAHPVIYTHPIGVNGHGAGMAIGSIGTNTFSVPAPIRGDFELHDHTCYALELAAVTYIPEWEDDIKMQGECTVAFVDGKLYYLDGRQEELHLI